MKTTPEYIMLTSLLTVQLMINCIENLKGTPYYNGVLKGKGNQFYQELLKVLRTDVGLIFGIEDKKMYTMMDYIEQGIQDMALIRPEEIGIRNEIMAMLREQPEEVLAALNIKIVESHYEERNQD